ncbi:MAG: WG repeat-containing protein [Bacteroidota bacterium]
MSHQQTATPTRRFVHHKVLLLIFLLSSGQALLAQDTTKIFSFGFAYSIVARASNGAFMVTNVYPNSPASRNNLVEGDIITAVNQKSAGAISFDQLIPMISNAKKAKLITLQINGEKDITLVPDTVSLLKCITGDCVTGFGRKEDYTSNRKSAGTFRNGLLNGYGNVTPVKGEFLFGTFQGFRIKEIEGIFENDKMIVLQNIWLSDGASYTGGVRLGIPTGKGTFKHNGLSYEGNFNQAGHMDGEFKVTLQNKEVKKITYNNTRIAPLFGYVDAQGILAIPPQYVTVFGFSEGYAIALTDNNELEIIDKKGNELGKMENYNEKGGFKDGLAAVGKNGKWGFVNTKGQLVTPLIYERPKDYKYEMAENYPGPQFKNGVAVVCRGGKFGTISTQGKTIIPIIYDAMQLYKGNYTVITKGKLQGVVDKQGKIVIEPKYNRIWMEDGDFFRVKKYEGSYTFSLFNTKGEEIPGTSGEHIIGKFENGFAFYQDIVRYKGIINSKGEKKPLDGYYLDAMKLAFVNGMAKISIDGKYGVVDTKGTILIPCKYYYLELYDGIATVTESKDEINSTVIDTRGNVIYKTNNTKRISMSVGSNMYYQNYIMALDDDRNVTILDKAGKALYAAPKGALVSYINQTDVFLLTDKTGIKKLIQSNGKLLFSFVYRNNYYTGFQDGLAPVGKN